MDEPWLVLKDQRLRSRLIVGIEQYEDAAVIRDVLAESRSELLIVTTGDRTIGRGVPVDQIFAALGQPSPALIGTTSFAQSAKEAIATARVLRDALGISLVKLDVRPGGEQNWPDNGATIHASKILLDEGFDVIPMILPDPRAALELQEMGCCALRLLAGPIRSGLGVTNLELMMSVKSAVGVPCVGEGGIGNVYDVALLMQNGFDAVLVNSAIASSAHPARMARAMRYAVAAGRLCYLAKGMPA